MTILLAISVSGTLLLALTINLMALAGLLHRSIEGRPLHTRACIPHRYRGGRVEAGEAQIGEVLPLRLRAGRDPRRRDRGHADLRGDVGGPVECRVRLQVGEELHALIAGP